MKKINVLVATVIVALGVSATSCDSKRSASLKTGADSASYAIGIANGSMFKPVSYTHLTLPTTSNV